MVFWYGITLYVLFIIHLKKNYPLLYYTKLISLEINCLCIVSFFLFRWTTTSHYEYYHNPYQLVKMFVNLLSRWWVTSDSKWKTCKQCKLCRSIHSEVISYTDSSLLRQSMEYGKVRGQRIFSTFHSSQWCRYWLRWYIYIYRRTYFKRIMSQTSQTEVIKWKTNRLLDH